MSGAKPFEQGVVMDDRNYERALLAMWESSGIIQRAPNARCSAFLRNACVLLDHALAPALAKASRNSKVYGKFLPQKLEKAPLDTGVGAREGAD